MLIPVCFFSATIQLKVKKTKNVQVPLETNIIRQVTTFFLYQFATFSLMESYLFNAHSSLLKYEKEKKRSSTG